MRGDDGDAEAHAAFLVAVLANTGRLQSFVEAARALLQDFSAEHIEEVASFLPRNLAVTLPRPVTIH
jgi:hypothetical protein